MTTPATFAGQTPPGGISYKTGSVPSWFAAARTVIDAVLNESGPAGWELGVQRSKLVTVTPAALGMQTPDFGLNYSAHLAKIRREYFTIGWFSELVDTTNNPVNGHVTGVVLEFSRWPQGYGD